MFVNNWLEVVRGRYNEGKRRELHIGFKRILKGRKDGVQRIDRTIEYMMKMEEKGGLQWSRELQLAAEELMKDVRVLENAEVFEFRNFDENEVDFGVKNEAEELMVRIKKFDEKMKMDGKGEEDIEDYVNPNWRSITDNDGWIIEIGKIFYLFI